MFHKKIIILSLLFTGIIPPLYAEKVILKNGKTIEGKILERTDKYIKIDLWDIPITYYLSDIDSIDGQKIVQPSTKEKKPVAESKPLEENKIPLKEKIPSLPIVPKEKLSLGELKEAQECLQRGTNFFKDRKYKEAAFEFENALKINPKLTEAYLGLGYVSDSSKNYDEAIGYFNKALEISPNYVEAYMGLAYVFNNAGNYDEAIKYYQKVLTIRKDYLEAYNGLGFIYASLGKNKEAIDYFKEALKIDREFAPAYSSLGVLYLSLGQDIEAKDNFLKAKEILEKNKDTEGVKAVEEYLKKLP